MNGARPGDDLITASLEEVRGPQQQAHHAPKAAPAKSKKVTRKTVKSRRPRATQKRRRR